MPPDDKRTWLTWLLLPSVFLVMHAVFSQVRGPFYLGPYTDPDYAYLCNSLNMATLRGPHHVDHPGTPLQVLGGVVIAAAHPFAGKEGKITAVLTQPEQHLRWINYVLAGAYAACLALVGLQVWRRTGQWYPAVLLQGAPFLLGDQFQVVTRVNAEAFLLIIGLLMAALLFLEARSEHAPWRTLIALAFLAVTGTATKINFFPLALVPLVSLRDWKRRALYLLSSGAFAFMWLLLLGDHKSQFFGWVKGLAFRQGRYGRGGAGILPEEYLSTCLRLLTDNPWLCLLVGASCATVVYGCARWKRQTPQNRRWLVLLGGLALAQALVMLLAAKFVNWRYLFPALIFSSLNLLLLIEYWGSTRRFMAAAIMIAALFPLASLPPLYSQLSKTRASRMQIVRALEANFKQEPKAFYYGASSPYHALWFGNFWAGSHYTQNLREVFASDAPAYIVRQLTGELGFMAQPMFLRDLCDRHPSFLLIGSNLRAPRIREFLPANAKVEKLLVEKDELIQRVSAP